MKIIYHKMSLFETPRGSCLVHGCNAQGKWGSGIAKIFAEKFPNSYTIYSEACKKQFAAVGNGFVIKDIQYYIGCLITSHDYGPRKDPPDVILKQTRQALTDFLSSFHGTAIYSNKFNSGLFDVPWEETEKIILEMSDTRVWNVCDPD